MRFQNTYRALQGMQFDPDALISLSTEDLDKRELEQLKRELSQPTYSKNGAGIENYNFITTAGLKYTF